MKMRNLAVMISENKVHRKGQMKMD